MNHSILTQRYACPFCPTMYFEYPGTYFLHMLDVHSVEITSVDAAISMEPVGILILQMSLITDECDDGMVPVYTWEKYASECGAHPDCFEIDFKDGTIINKATGELYFERIGSKLRY